jgi:hypothetical protein
MQYYILMDIAERRLDSGEAGNPLDALEAVRLARAILFSCERLARPEDFEARFSWSVSGYEEPLGYDECLSRLESVEEIGPVPEPGEMLKARERALEARAFLARALAAAGRPGKGLELAREAVRGFEALGRPPSGTAEGRMSAAAALLALGRHGEAAAELESALAACGGSGGWRYGDKVRCAGMLAKALRLAGTPESLARARALGERVLAAREERFGPAARPTLEAAAALARTCLGQGGPPGLARAGELCGLVMAFGAPGPGAEPSRAYRAAAEPLAEAACRADGPDGPDGPDGRDGPD